MAISSKRADANLSTTVAKVMASKDFRSSQNYICALAAELGRKRCSTPTRLCPVKAGSCRSLMLTGRQVWPIPDFHRIQSIIPLYF